MKNALARSSALPGYTAAVLGVVVATALLGMVQAHLGNAYVGLVFLLVVAAVAAIGGTRPAVLAAFLAFLAWNFFFVPPYHTFEVADRQDWIMLLAFLVIGLIVGQMTGRLRLREEEAVWREKRASALYRVTREAAAQRDVQGALSALLEHLMEATRARGVMLVVMTEGNVEAASRLCRGSLAPGEVEALVRASATVLAEAKAVGLGRPSPDLQVADVDWPVSVRHADMGLVDRSDVFLPLLVGDHPHGVLYARAPAHSSFAAEDLRLVVALGSQASALLERQRLQEAAGRAFARQEAERLKSILLSSLSHNLKTPVVSLAATLSSLRGDDVQWEAGVLRESLDDMAEDVQRLREHIEKLLHIAQLESGGGKPQREPVELTEVLHAALGNLREAERRRVCLGSLPELPAFWVDVTQMSQALGHLLENALAYSPPGSLVTVGAHVEGQCLDVWIDDEGAGVAPEERQMVFEKFYRGAAARRGAVRGTGLGLAISREIVGAHGGTLHLESASGGGARFRVSLPLAPLSGEDRP